MKMFYMTCGSIATLFLAGVLRVVDNPKDIVLNTLIFGLVLCAFMLLFIIAILDDKFYDGELMGIIKEFRNKDKDNDNDPSSKEQEVV